MADTISGWAQSRAAFTLRKIRVSSRACTDPDDLVDAINDIRTTMRRAFDRRQRENERWRTIRCVGCFTPSFDGISWSATFNGIIELGRVHEVTFLDAFEPLVQVRLQSFPSALIEDDVHNHMHLAFSTMGGLSSCEPIHLALYFNTITRHGGFKPLIFRRGVQS